MTWTVKNRARRMRLVNVRTIVGDLLRDGSGLGDESVDYVMLFGANPYPASGGFQGSQAE